MKAYLINPKTIEIQEVELEEDEAGSPTLESVYSHIGCRWIDVARLANGSRDVLYVDDEGLLDSSNELFRHAEYHSPLAGIALCVGTDEQGNTTPPVCTIDELRDRVSWLIK